MRAHMAPFHVCLLWLQAAFMLGSALAHVHVRRGQQFTRGLAIFDSPAPNSQMHAGSSFTIAVDVSGNGQLSRPQFRDTGIDSLNISLVSSQTSHNLTVVTSPDFLGQEPGSTVKHYNMPIPQCVPSGNYNLTVYELAHIGDSQFFSITPIPITIQNSQQSGQCSGLNKLEDQPQPDSPPLQNPFTNPGFLPSNTFIPLPSGSLSGMTTIPSNRIPYYQTPSTAIPTVVYTVGPSGAEWPLTVTVPGLGPVVVGPTDLPGGIAVSSVFTDMIPSAQTVSPGEEGTVVIVVGPTAMPAPVTVVLASVETSTVTQTVQGQAGVVTKTTTVFTTTTGVIGMDTQTNIPDPGFLPINAISAGIQSSAFCLRMLLLPVALSLVW